MSAAKRRTQSVQRRRWMAEALGVDVVEPEPVSRARRPRLVLVPTKRKAARHPWADRLLKAIHGDPDAEATS